LTRETDDNVSVVVFHVRSLMPDPAEENWHPKPSWFKKRRNLA
jgi:hypothetical protein